MTQNQKTPEDVRVLLDRVRLIRARIEEEIAKQVFGQEEVVELLLIALFSRGHTLMMGVPGLAKTLLISTLSKILKLTFKRIQFTPDLMPSDITGTEILEDNPVTGKRQFTFDHGPIFSNLLLADEINRTPPKTQAALLQAMQEGEVTSGGKNYSIAPPFLVFATQNPIEQEGTYPLPEAQLDRFMFHINVHYPSFDDEMKIARLTTTDRKTEILPVLTAKEILELQHIVYGVEVSDTVITYAVNLVRATRPDNPKAIPEIKQYVNYGAGPRATQYLILGAKARALLRGFETPSIEDVRAISGSVLRHRILPNFHAEADGITSDILIQKLLSK